MYKIKYWILAARPQTLIASVGPVVISSILSYKYFNFNFIIFFFIIISAILIQIMTNFINDLYDFKKGADSNKRQGPHRMIQKGYISEKEMKIAIMLTMALAVFSGLYLVLIGGWPILAIGLSGFLFAYLYTATKFSIAYNGLGEIFVFLYFGVIASMGTFFIYNSTFHFHALLAGCMFGFLNTSLLIINNIRDYHSDILANKNTTTVIFGVTFAKIELLLVNIGAFISLFLLLESVKKNFSIFIIFILFSIFFFYKIIANNEFLNKKALPQFSFYLICITIVLSLVLLYDF